MVSTISLVFMGISALIAMGLPVALFIFWRKKQGLKLIPLLVGAAVFVVFALVLEQILHAIVLQPDPLTGDIALKSQPVLYVLYGCLAAGIFEETGRFIAFLLLKKRYSGVGTGLSYGIGHGGFEAVLLVGFGMIQSIVLAVMLNGGGEQALSFLGAMAPQTVDALVSSPAPLFLVSGAERVFAVAIQVALSVIVWYAATTPGKAWLFPAAIILHALVDAVPAIYQTGAAINVYAVEGILVVWALILSVIAWQVHKKYKVVESVEAGGPVEKNGPPATDEPTR